MMGLSHQKQLLPYGRDSCFACNRCHIFMKKSVEAYGMNRRRLAFCYSTFERLWKRHSR